MENITRLLKEGIQAVRAGQRERGKALLMQVIELDEENEKAWLWLSGAVETEEERSICLENVLTINPDNELAKKGLARLKPVREAEEELPASFAAEAAPADESETISEAALPPSLEAQAAQLNRAGSQAEASWWMAEPLVEPATAVPKFNDVWAGNEDLCAFCAEPVSRTHDRCPKCKRPLIAKALVNSVPGMHYARLLTWLTVFISLRVVGIIVVLIIVFTASASMGTLLLAESFATFLPLIVATMGVYKRQTWAYWLLLAISIIETGLLAVVAFSSGSFGILVCMSPLLALSLYVLFTIYMAGEDFRKVPVRRVAAVSDRFKEPRDLDKIAQQLAKEGMWAAAVLHWQRAIGRASGHAPYLLRLGHAFAELGFYERSLDMLQTAREAARNSELRQEVEQEMVRVTRQSQLQT